MDKNELNLLIDKVNEGKASDEELELYNFYLNQLTTVKENWNALEMGNEEITKSELNHRIMSEIISVPRKFSLWSKIAVAASVLFVFSVIGKYVLRSNQKINEYTQQDVLPGRNQATLTLSNGKKIIITKNITGNLAQQFNQLIKVNKHHEVVYAASGQAQSGSSVYNTLSTAVGEQSPGPLLMSDGTEVMLDAQSSIRFPVSFNGPQRRVQLTGQAWFKVKHNDKQPFIVELQGQEVKDIGTEFNINAYSDEPETRTTLINGKIVIIKSGTQTILAPGQQAITTQKSSFVNIKEVEIDEVTAWKNGKFQFNDSKITTVMKQLSRWYNIDVRYEKMSTDEGFNGIVSRDKNISVVLKMLQQTQGVHFKIEGRRVTVMQ